MSTLLELAKACGFYEQGVQLVGCKEFLENYTLRVCEAKDAVIEPLKKELTTVIRNHQFLCSQLEPLRREVENRGVVKALEELNTAFDGLTVEPVTASNVAHNRGVQWCKDAVVHKIEELRATDRGEA